MSSIFKQTARAIEATNRFQSPEHVQIIGKYSNLTNEELQEKKKILKSKKFTRYFSNHKFRTIAILIAVIIVIICFIFDVPVTGDIEINQGWGVKLLSILGYISSNIFLGLLVTVLGVETYLSREEMKELDDEFQMKALDGLNITQKKSSSINSSSGIYKTFLNKLKKLNKKFFNKILTSNKSKKYNTDIQGTNELIVDNIQPDILINNIKQNLYELDEDEYYTLISAIEELNKQINEEPINLSI